METTAIKLGLLAAATTIIVALIVCGYLQPINEAGRGIYVLNRFTGSLLYCSYDESNECIYMH